MAPFLLAHRLKGSPACMSWMSGARSCEALNSDSPYRCLDAGSVQGSFRSERANPSMSRLEREIAGNPTLLYRYQELVKNRFGYRFYWNQPTPREIVDLLSLEEVERRIASRRARLVFDGRYLEWIEDGRVDKRWPAISGKIGFNGKKHQMLKDTGPIPEGSYAAQQSDFQRWEDASIFNRAACVLAYLNYKAGLWPGCPIAWGTRRVWLRPSPSTNVYGRDNFSIHGGWFPGSIGCIDLTDSMNAFAKEFLLYAKDMELEVRY